NMTSPFNRFRVAYLDAHPDIVSEINSHQINRDRHEEAARKARDELRRINCAILGAFRDEERKRSKHVAAVASGATCEATMPDSDSPNVPAPVLGTAIADTSPSSSASTDHSFATPEQKP